MVVLILTLVHFTIAYALGSWIGWWTFVLTSLFILGFVRRLPTYRRVAPTPMGVQMALAGAFACVAWIVGPILGSVFGWEWLN